MADELKRIEDFIDLAKKGTEVHLEVELEKQSVSQKSHPGFSEEEKSEMEMYLLMGNYVFKVDGNVNKISKVYVYGSSQEPLNDSKINKNIANVRLKIDYNRLKEANIKFEEKYF